MAIQIDITKMENNEDRSLVFPPPKSEYQVGEPQITVMGVTFPKTSSPKRPLTTDYLMFGTYPLEREGIDLPKLNIALVFPAEMDESGNLVTAERYARLRKQIVESGLSLLSGEELRQEIRERKGVKTESEA
jgi:hypothetical protein